MALRELLQTAVDCSAARASRAIERLSSRLADTQGAVEQDEAADLGEAGDETAGEDQTGDAVEEVVEDLGAVTGAVAGGDQAVMAHENPVWGALKGAWSGTRTSTKIWVAVALVVLALVVVLIVLAVRRAPG